MTLSNDSHASDCKANTAKAFPHQGWGRLPIAPKRDIFVREMEREEAKDKEQRIPNQEFRKSRLSSSTNVLPTVVGIKDNSRLFS